MIPLLTVETPETLKRLIQEALLSYEALATFVEDSPFHLLGDGQSLMHQLFGQFVHQHGGHREDEIVLAIATECQRAVVLAEEGCVVHTPRKTNPI